MVALGGNASQKPAGFGLISGEDALVQPLMLQPGHGAASGDFPRKQPHPLFLRDGHPRLAHGNVQRFQTFRRGADAAMDIGIRQGVQPGRLRFQPFQLFLTGWQQQACLFVVQCGRHRSRKYIL